MPFDVQAYLRSLSRFGMKPGLERIRAILARLGDPQERFPAVHIGGTNGKGSIAALTASVLRRAGYTVGLYTSPHLVRYNERIRVNGEMIGDEDLVGAVREVAAAAAAVKEELGSDPTEFEVGTAAAFLHFARSEVDVAVVEVGLGGRLDSTNVLRSAAVALGPISLDHMSVLGWDVASIAAEKAGIFRPGVPAVIAPQPAAAEAVLLEAARRVGCPLVRVRELPADVLGGWSGTAAGEVWEAAYSVGAWGLEGGTFDVATPWGRHRGLRVGLLGRHQMQNAAVAVTLLGALGGRGFSIAESSLREGVRSARWPGRLEFVPGSPALLLDGVHNPGGAQALSASLGRLLGAARPVFVMAVLGERDVRGVLEPLLPFAARLFATRPASSRTPPAEPEELVRVAQEHGVPAEVRPNARAALAAACRAAGPAGIVCVCGSLYLVGEVKALLESGWTPADEESRHCLP